MIKENNRENLRRTFIEGTIGTRKYFSYRADLLLYKTALSLVVFAALYVNTSELFISVVVAIQIFAVFTFVNKMNLERKAKEGEEKIMKKIKAEYFADRLINSNYEEFERMARYFLMKKGYSNYEKRDMHTYCAVKDSEKILIKFFKLFKEAEIEKIDIRNFIVQMQKNNFDKGCVLTVNKIDETAQKLIESSKKDIEVIDMDKMYAIAEESDLLPVNRMFYNDVKKEKIKKEKKPLENIFGKNKIIIYLLSSLLFYFISKFASYSNTGVYIAYYFAILAIINGVCILWSKYSMKFQSK